MRHPFIERTNQRTLPADYTGDVLLWDIDKTYLDTAFSSFRGLMRIPMESALDKRAVPGTVPLLRALRRGADLDKLVPLYFVSGSPPQLRGIVEKKMTLDGVQFDGITFKDQWALVKARRPRGIKEQVGYKLRALLLYRLETPVAARWLLFGDDVESDAAVFSLFGEVCAGLRDEALTRRLRDEGVHDDDVENVHEIAASVPVTEQDPVERIFIHLSNKSDPEKIASAQVVPTRSFLQTAMVLAQMGRIRPDAVAAVVENMRRNGWIREADIQAHVEDAQERLSVSDELAAFAQPRA